MNGSHTKLSREDRAKRFTSLLILGRSLNLNISFWRSFGNPHNRFWCSEIRMPSNGFECLRMERVWRSLDFITEIFHYFEPECRVRSFRKTSFGLRDQKQSMPGNVQLNKINLLAHKTSHRKAILSWKLFEVRSAYWPTLNWNIKIDFSMNSIETIWARRLTY